VGNIGAGGRGVAGMEVDSSDLGVT
jgi:hypothetical protein